MTVQMTVRIDDDLAAFIDRATESGEGSRADVINAAIRREVRRREAVNDAAIYARSARSDREQASSDAWAIRNAEQVWADLD